MAQLFETISIGNLKLKNRFVRSATCEAMADEDGGVTPKLINTFVALAEGEVGLIISGHANVERRGWGGPGQLGLQDDRLIPGLKEMTDAVHKAGGKIMAQLAHQGIWAPPELSSMEPLCPSDYAMAEGPDARAMTKTEIRETINSFADAALRAEKAGFDGVQIHAAHGGLLGEFLSAFFNKRSDSHGGTLENRARIVLEALQAIREKVGPDYPVIAKINSNDFLKDGFTEEEMLEVCTMLEAHGIDGIELSGGTMHPKARFTPARLGTKKPEAWYREACKRLRQKVSVPVILVGGIRTFATAQELVTEGTCDAVSLSRPLVRQPDLVRRWKEDCTAKATCIACNKCFEPIMDGSGLRCMMDEKKKNKK